MQGVDIEAQNRKQAETRSVAWGRRENGERGREEGQRRSEYGEISEGHMKLRGGMESAGGSGRRGMPPQQS